MINVIRDASLTYDKRHVGVLEVHYPDDSNWDVAAFKAYRDKILDEIRTEGADYSRDTVFRGTPYFRYFRKYGQTYPVTKQLESLLLKGRPFPEDEFVNSIAFLSELKTHALIGTHDVDKIEGDMVFYKEDVKREFPAMVRDGAHTYPGDVTGRDDKGIIISMISGVDSRTCLNENSRNVVYLIFGTSEMTKEEIDAVAEITKTSVLTLAETAEISYSII